MKNRKAFFFCIFISIFLHLTALIFVNRHLFRSYLFEQLLSDSSQSTNENAKGENSAVLEMCFFEKDFVDLEKESLTGQQENSVALPSVDFAGTLAEISPHKKEYLDFDLPHEHASSLKKVEPSNFRFESALSRAKNLLKTEDGAFLMPYDLERSQEENRGSPIHESLVLQFEATNMFYPRKEIFHDHLFQAPSILRSSRGFQKQDFSSSFSYKRVFERLFRFPSPLDLQTVSRGGDFDVDIVYNVQDDSEGYIFALTLIPRPNSTFKKIKQNFYFIIDSSTSMNPERLTKARHAIFSVLRMLEEDDHFNIFSFHDMRELFPREMSVNPCTLQDAKRFLFSQKRNNSFSGLKISVPFNQFLSRSNREDECYSIIYLSNGDNLNKGLNRKFFQEWTKKNKGRISFYSISLDSDKNKAILDYFSSANKGKLFLARTSTGIRRQLKKLVYSIHHPIANRISAHIFLAADNMEMKLFPAVHHLPNLYVEQPYVFIGSTKKLDPFVLFLQGRSSDRWINIRKSISFDHAEKGSLSLYEQWAIEQSYLCYDSYLSDGDPKHLKQAERFLHPFYLTPAFR